MALLSIDTDKCKKDGICAAVCPMGIIEWAKGGNPRPAPEAEELCIACGHCVAACPHGAMNHRDMPSRDCPPIQKDLVPSPEQIKQFLRSRRSVRVYEPDPPDRQAITELLQVAAYAPSGHNTQPTQWIVRHDREELTRLSGLVIDWMKVVIQKQPELAATLHMERVVARWEAGTDTILRGAPVLIQAHAPKDERTAPQACTIALAYVELAAPAFGLGACWAGFFNAASLMYPPLGQELGLPPGHQVFGSMMLGKPRYRYYRLPLRKQARITWA